MSWDTVPGRNGEGYPDPTASTALARVQHSQKGLQSKRAGEHFENMITASLNWYCDKGVAFVEKTPEPMKPLRKPDRQGRFLACYTKAGQPDFKGTLAGGRAVVFEAKHTDSDKIDQSRLTPEQVESLTLHHKLGAAAFIMVSVGLENFYRVPWEVWRDMKQIYGRKHMKLEDLEPYRVQYIAGILKLLEGVEIDYTEEGRHEMRILRAPQSRAFCNFKSLHHAERKDHKQTDGRTVKNLYAPHGLPGSVYEQRERLRALQITERRSRQ